MTRFQETRAGVIDAVSARLTPEESDEQRPRLTRRGWALVGVVTGLVVLGWRYSPRQINAVAAPALVALLVGVVSVRRGACHTVEVRSPPPGVPGEERTLSVSLDGGGLATVGVELAAGAPLTDGTTSAETAVRLPATVEWTVSLEQRGIYDVGPLAVRLHGPLGLVEQEVREETAVEVVVYPQRYDLSEPAAARGELHTRHDVVTQEFDRIREYRPGDPLRRVDWKASAKHRDLHVVEFTDRAGQQAVVIGGVAARDTEDRMASAVATLAEAALDAGLDVGIVVPAGRCDPDSGPDHRERLLRLLARTGPSSRADYETLRETELSQQEADIVVDASNPLIRERGADPTIRTAYGSYSLGELRNDGRASRAAEGAG